MAIAHAPLKEQVAFLGPDCPERFKLIYWDPPFFSQKIHSAVRGTFSDRWTTLDSYLNEMDQHLAQMIPLLHRDGFLAVHCDWHASHYLKVLGDQVLGYDNFRNEIIWHYTGRRQPAGRRINSKHDVILIWSRSKSATMNPVSDQWSREEYIRMKKQKVHEDGGREWIWGHKGKGQSHAYRIYLDEVVAQGRAIDTVWEIPIINTSAKERVGYPTQKPLKLLERLLLLLTNEGDWVADFMMGSGTFAVAALENRRNVWAGDENVEAFDTTLQRIELINELE